VIFHYRKLYFVTSQNNFFISPLANAKQTKSWRRGKAINY
jgi:hypothetical protein